MKLEEALVQCVWVQKKLGQLYGQVKRKQIDEVGAGHRVGCLAGVDGAGGKAATGRVAAGAHSSASMARISSASVGSTRVPKLLTTRPSRSSRYLWKFQRG